MTRRRVVALVAVAACVLAVAVLAPAGCERSNKRAERDRLRTALSLLAFAYLFFQESEKRPPTSLEELKTRYELTPEAAQLTVFWGAGMGQMCKDGDMREVIIAHAPDPAGKGVLVLFCDSRVDMLTDEEFAATKKATPPKP
jgi:hypothetical protein